MENCSTQLAAVILYFGIVILAFRNYTPIDSIISPRDPMTAKVVSLPKLRKSY